MNKILHIIGSLDRQRGGTYSALYSIMIMENALGHSNEVLFVKENGQQYDKTYFNNKVHVFEASFPKRFRFSEKGIKWLKRNIQQYDLVVIHEVWGGLAARSAIVAKESNVKYVIWPHGSLDPFDLQKKNFLKKILGNAIVGKIISNAEAICCTSDLEKRVLETYKQTPKSVAVLPLPVDYNQKGNRENFRKKFSLNNDSFVFLFLSRIDYKKGLDIFLLALGNYLKHNQPKDIKVVIAGAVTENYQNVIDKIISENNLSSHVIHAGFLSGAEKADALTGANCFILTSMNENYGISTIEALQSGLPVLISNNIYIWEKIIPKGGWVCDYSVKSIENVFEQIVNGTTISQKEPKKMGEQFKTPSLTSQYKSFYNSLN